MTVFSKWVLGNGPRCFAATSKTILRHILLLMMLFPGWASAQRLLAPVCTLVALPASISTGASSTLTAVCSPLATSYAWTGGTCGRTTASSCTDSPSATTTYTVAGINAAGTGAAASAIVTVTCAFSLSSTGQSVAAGATNGTLSVTSAAGCAWTATSNVAWITISSGSSGSGNGTVGYAVAANSSGSSRSGTLTIQNQTFTVSQDAGLVAPSCILTALPASISAGGSSTLTAICSPAPTSYTWTGGTCAGTNASSCTVTPAATTGYAVAGINSAGAGATASATVTVTPTPSPPNPNQPVAPPPVLQTDYTFVTNVIPDAAVSATASGTLDSVTLNVTLNLSSFAGFFTGQGQFAAGYNIYVAAYVPSGRQGLPAAMWFMLPASPGFWTQFALPMAAFLQNVAQNASVSVGILQNMDMTELTGTEFYIGYGLSDEEMLNAGRYRGVYIAR